MTVFRSCDMQRIGDLMNTLMERARVGLASARTRHGLTETKLRELLSGERAYKVSDGGNGLCVVVSPSVSGIRRAGKGGRFGATLKVRHRFSRTH